MDRRQFLSIGAAGTSVALMTNMGIINEANAWGKAQIGKFGFDMDGRDLSIKAGDDFFRFAGGNWIKKNQIPNDRTRWGMFDVLRAKSETDVKTIIDDLAKKKNAAGSVEQKIGDFWRTYMDVDAIDKIGISSIQSELDAINNAKTHEDIAIIFGRPDLPTPSPIAWYVGLDDRNPDRYLVTINHSGLGLPERDYYLKDDARMKELREKYPQHIEKMLGLAGIQNPSEKAKAIMALETEIAKLHWPIEDRRNSTKMYNLTKRKDLDTIAPDFPWAFALGASKFNDIEECVVGELSSIGPIAKLFRATSVEDWKSYLTFHLISKSSGLLPQKFDDENFEFFSKTLNGQKEKKARWKRGTQAIDGALGEAIGKVYAKRFFSPKAKKQAIILVENLRKAFKNRIAGLSWMSESTKLEAYKKLASFNPKIGYPDKWKDYSKLEIKAGDAIGNARRAQVFGWQFDLERLGRKTDKGEWFMTPQTVNAYYNPVFNEIVFPAAILQPPFFDPNADDAINYGAIGAVIGHEMGHGFDDQGAKYNDKGVLSDWWQESDVKAFDVLGQKMVAQYGGFEPLPNVKLNGQLTLGENIGDHCGVVVGLEAYNISLKGKKAKTLDGTSGEQRFFYSWSQVWRALIRDEALRNQVQSDPHSPAEYRVNGTVQNVDQWYVAFDVKEGDKLYLAPEKRVKIW